MKEQTQHSLFAYSLSLGLSHTHWASARQQPPPFSYSSAAEMHLQRRYNIVCELCVPKECVSVIEEGELALASVRQKTIVKSIMEYKLCKVTI